MTIERAIMLAGSDLIEQRTQTRQARRVSLDDKTLAVIADHWRKAEENCSLRTITCRGRIRVFRVGRRERAIAAGFDHSRSRTLFCRANVRNVRLHDLHHYVATRLFASGVEVRTVAGRLGHRNPATTLNVYAHFVPESDRRAADVLRQMLGNALGRPSTP